MRLLLPLLTLTPSRNGSASLREKYDRLLAPGSLDAEGRIDLHLDDLYDGGAFDVDIEVFGQKRTRFISHCISPRSPNMATN